MAVKSRAIPTIRELAEDKGFTPAHLAERAALPIPAVQAIWDNPDQAIGTDTLVQLATALGISVTRLALSVTHLLVAYYQASMQERKKYEQSLLQQEKATLLTLAINGGLGHITYPPEPPGRAILDTLWSKEELAELLAMWHRPAPDELEDALWRRGIDVEALQGKLVQA